MAHAAMSMDGAGGMGEQELLVPGMVEDACDAEKALDHGGDEGRDGEGVFGGPWVFGRLQIQVGLFRGHATFLEELPRDPFCLP